MKKPAIHYAYYAPSGYLVACGLSFWRYLSMYHSFVKLSDINNKATCRNCRRTKVFKKNK